MFSSWFLKWAVDQKITREASVFFLCCSSRTLRWSWSLSDMYRNILAAINRCRLSESLLVRGGKTRSRWSIIVSRSWHWSRRCDSCLLWRTSLCNSCGIGMIIAVMFFSIVLCFRPVRAFDNWRLVSCCSSSNWLLTLGLRPAVELNHIDARTL